MLLPNLARAETLDESPISIITSEAVISPEDLSSDQDIDLQIYEGIEIAEVKEVPTRFGLFLRNIRNSISIALSIDPLKKAEKRLAVAEWYNQVAERILAISTDEKAQQRAQTLLDKSSKIMDKVERARDKIIQKGGDRAHRLIKNSAIYSLRKENLLDKIEDRIPEEKRERFHNLRDQATEQNRRLENALQNVNIPDEVKEKLTQIKERMEERASNREAFMEQKKELIDAVKNGDEDAREQLRNLKDERQQENIKKEISKDEELKSEDNVVEESKPMERGPLPTNQRERPQDGI